MKQLLLSFCLATGLPGINLAQSVQVLHEGLISEGIEAFLNEPHLITDPQNPNHLLVGAILTESWVAGQLPQAHILLLQSWDAGLTWESRHFHQGVHFGGDPWLAMNEQGTVILTALSGLEGRKGIHLLALVSRDSGQTWMEERINLGTRHDRQSIVVDPQSQSFLIVSARFHPDNQQKVRDGIMVSRLSAQGNFMEAHWHPLSNLGKNNGTPVILPDRTLLIPYADFMLNGRMLKTRRHWLVSSPDLGRSLGDPFMISEGRAGLPQLLVDSSQSSQATILHYLGSKGGQREYKGFYTKRSTNAGYTWGQEIDIGPYTGENPYLRNANWALNQRGEIGVFWQGRYEDAQAAGHDLYFAYSTDQGNTFSQPVKVSSATSFPDPENNGMVDKRWPVGGDYFGVNATREGDFRVVWVDHRNGRPQLFFALVKLPK